MEDGVAGVLRCFGEGFHTMSLEGYAPTADVESAPAPPLVVVALDSTPLRAYGATLVGSRVRVHGVIEGHGVAVDGPRGTRIRADVLIRAARLEDLEPAAAPPTQRRPTVSPRPVPADRLTLSREAVARFREEGARLDRRAPRMRAR